MKLQNQCLLQKFWVKLHEPSSTSWQRWFHSIYGLGAGKDLGDAHYLDTPVWRSLLDLLQTFRATTQVHIGNGQHTSFWHDHWLGPAPLSHLMPALYSHSTRPNITVAAARGNGLWNLSLRLSQAAINEMQALANAPMNCQLPLQQDDHRLLISSNRPYTATGAYRLAWTHLPDDPEAPLIWQS